MDLSNSFKCKSIQCCELEDRYKADVIKCREEKLRFKLCRRKATGGGPRYNGGHSKREALHSMADLLYAAKTNFPNSKVFLNSILIRHDIGYKALHDFNVQLDLMCSNFGVDFMEANTCVGRRDLTRDGVHFNKRGFSRLGSLFVTAVSTALQSLASIPAFSPSDRVEAAPAPLLGLGPVPGIVLDDPPAIPEPSQVSGN
ncbi:hypothetical protein J6590_051480 [Homalodisca vitripennis]|nr:hypothetical protein J6590_051480 [Homalodisca vitripennis]